ncbi:hypothetical protein DBV05_g7031 [Lasiodiplodia theobromae]|uniref:3-carboxymuconate cyclase n=1 Tax=Lasiodiplodia theobromae TaxID=45133 RepID=A0A5N5D9C6_9PEZI|nr:hypothetical protein DBV05_g7031 [Lasiodiplodia theobromae]
MYTLFRNILLFASTLATAAPSGQRYRATGRAIYFLTNDANNAVVSIPIAADGTLSEGTVTVTGGAGSNAINGANNMPAAPDALVAQSSLTIAGNNLFAVNAGSNTLSMFTISPSDPTKLTPVGRPATVPGDFPNTVAASPKHNLVCVGTTGARAGITCTTFSPTTGLMIDDGLAMDALRPFDLGQSTPPVGPTNTVSQVFFSDDESKLFTTVKGDPASNKTGFFSVFAVEQNLAGSRLAMHDTRSSPPGTAVLFGSAAVRSSNSRVFVTDPSFGAAVLDVDEASGVATLAARGAIAGQKATCWATISEATRSAFVADAGMNRMVEMSLEDASVISMVDLSSAEDRDLGLTDLKAAGNFVYALSPGNGTTAAAVTVLDVSGGKGAGPRMVQHFELTGLGVGKNAQGMAVLV